MAIECPHCFTYVHVGGDGQCPSCREDTNDVRGLDRDLTTVVIGENSPIPDVCCTCGVQTRRSINIKQSKTGDAPTGALLVAMNLLFGWIGAIYFHALRMIWRYSSDGGQTVSVRLTQCELCATEGPPRPLRVNYESCTMRFVVHRDFKARFEELIRERVG